MTKIPRGVADQDRQVAVVHDQRGSLIAVDLASGTVRWRGGVNLRPCSIVGDSVVAARVNAQHELTIVTTRLNDGREEWSTPPIALPGWVRPTLDDRPEFELRAETHGQQVALHWVARARYRGGAAPSQQVLARQAEDAAGVVRLNLADRTVRSTAEPPGEPAEPLAPRPQVGAKPDVVDRTELGGLVLELVLHRRAQADAVSLRAVEPGNEAFRWEVTLDDAIERRVPKLRP
jgi:hypothetical protein